MIMIYINCGCLPQIGMRKEFSSGYILKLSCLGLTDESDWEWLRILSSNIDDYDLHNLWLPASDRNEEGVLKWLHTEGKLPGSNR